MSAILRALITLDFIGDRRCRKVTAHRRAGLRDAESIDERCEMAAFGSFPSPRQARRNSIIQLNGDDERDTPVGVENAEQRAEGVEGLGNQNAVLNGSVDFAGEVGFQQRFFDRTGPTQVKDDTEQKDVEPVDYKRGAITGELGEKSGGKGIGILRRGRRCESKRGFGRNVPDC